MKTTPQRFQKENNLQTIVYIDYILVFSSLYFQRTRVEIIRLCLKLSKLK